MLPPRAKRAYAAALGIIEICICGPRLARNPWRRLRPTARGPSTPGAGYGLRPGAFSFLAAPALRWVRGAAPALRFPPLRCAATAARFAP